jgi:hypothetical protein
MPRSAASGLIAAEPYPPRTARLGARSPRTVSVTYCDGSSGPPWDAWDDSWDEYRPYPCAMCAFRASACGIRAGRTLLAPQRSSFIRGFWVRAPGAPPAKSETRWRSTTWPVSRCRSPDVPACMPSQGTSWRPSGPWWQARQSAKACLSWLADCYPRVIGWARPSAAGSGVVRDALRGPDWSRAPSSGARIWS